MPKRLPVVTASGPVMDSAILEPNSSLCVDRIRLQISIRWSGLTERRGCRDTLVR